MLLDQRAGLEGAGLFVFDFEHNVEVIPIDAAQKVAKGSRIEGVNVGAELLVGVLAAVIDQRYAVSSAPRAHNFGKGDIEQFTAIVQLVVEIVKDDGDTGLCANRQAVEVVVQALVVFAGEPALNIGGQARKVSMKRRTAAGLLPYTPPT